VPEALFKQLKPHEVAPLLKKTKRGEPLSDKEHALVKGTLHAAMFPRDVQSNDPRLIRFVLDGIHRDSLMEEALSGAMELDLERLRHADAAEIADHIERLTDLVYYIHGKAADTRNALDKRRQGGRAGSKEFKEFTHVDELPRIEKLRADLDSLISEKARTVGVKQFFANLAKDADERPELLRHSRVLDKFLGIQHNKTEKEFQQRELAGHEEHEQFYYEGTPFQHIHSFLKALRLTSSDVLYDLGSGYGRVPFYAALTTPVRKAVGIELIPERVKHCNELKERHGIGNVEFRAGNVLGHDFSDGTVFFLFNPFYPATLQKVIEKLEKIPHGFRIAGWGPCNDYLDRVPWLEKEMDLGSEPHKQSRLVIYRRAK
jgi:hypothetical protein